MLVFFMSLRSRFPGCHLKSVERRRPSLTLSLPSCVAAGDVSPSSSISPSSFSTRSSLSLSSFSLVSSSRCKCSSSSLRQHFVLLPLSFTFLGFLQPLLFLLPPPLLLFRLLPEMLLFFLPSPSFAFCVSISFCFLRASRFSASTAPLPHSSTAPSLLPLA